MASRGPPPGMGPIMVLSKSKYPLFFQNFNADTTSRLAKKNGLVGLWIAGWKVWQFPIDDAIALYHLQHRPLRTPSFVKPIFNDLAKRKTYSPYFLSFIIFFFLFFFFYNIPDSKTQRTQGRQAQLGNINAARAVADIIRSTLGPRSMLKVR